MAVQAYSWSNSTYRHVGQALQVSEMAVYRWVSAWGQRLLPVAAIFGLVRSRGVVGVDEKYVLAPKKRQAGRQAAALDVPLPGRRCPHLRLAAYSRPFLMVLSAEDSRQKPATTSRVRCRSDANELALPRILP
ncbi:MAG: hypothetical protein ACUVWZ_07425 [Anaerolineae bacterium]